MVAGALDDDEEEDDDDAVVVVAPVPVFEDEEHPARTRGTIRATGMNRFKVGVPFTRGVLSDPSGSKVIAGTPASSLHPGKRRSICVDMRHPRGAELPGTEQQVNGV
jgi:hypothetical protein